MKQAIKPTIGGLTNTVRETKRNPIVNKNIGWASASALVIAKRIGTGLFASLGSVKEYRK